VGDNELVVDDEEKTEDGEEVVVDNGGVAAMLLDDSGGVGLGNNELDESRVVVLNADEADVDDDLNTLVLDDSELVVVVTS